MDLLNGGAPGRPMRIVRCRGRRGLRHPFTTPCGDLLFWPLLRSVVVDRSGIGRCRLTDAELIEAMRSFSATKQSMPALIDEYLRRGNGVNTRDEVSPCLSFLTPSLPLCGVPAHTRTCRLRFLP